MGPALMSGYWRTKAVRLAPASTTAIFIGWPICFAFTIPASMILWAFSIVIMTVELLIESGQAAFTNNPCGWGTNLAAMPLSNWA